MELKRLRAYFRGPWAFWEEYRFDTGYKKHLLLAGFLVIFFQVLFMAFVIFSNSAEFGEAVRAYYAEGHTFGLWLPVFTLFLFLVLFQFFEIFLRTILIYGVTSVLGDTPRFQKAFLLGLYSMLPEVILPDFPGASVVVPLYLGLFLIVGLMKLFRLSFERALIGLVMGVALWFMSYWILGVFLGVILTFGFFVFPDALKNFFQLM